MATAPPSGVTMSADQFNELKQLLKGGDKKSSSPSALPDAASLKESLKTSSGALEDFKKSTLNSLDTWRALTKAGSNFSNDVIGMSVSAAQSRLSLEDFADVVKENGKYMSGLGGSVSRGSEAFAKLSKGFFDANLDQGLRQLGYTSKDLNEILAFQASVTKSSFKDEAEQAKFVQQSAAEMAKEMDMIAKLTGKSRQEQMEQMKQARVDGQVESKLRLLTAGKNEEEAAKIRADFKKGLMDAQKNGSEQAYKEFYATGTYITEAGQNQAAILGKQIRAQEEAIKASQAGNIAEAEAKRQISSAEAIKNANDKTILTIGTLGSAAGSIGDTVTKFVSETDTMYHAIVKTAKSADLMLKNVEDYSKAIALAKEEIEKSSRGKNKENEQVDGATKGLVEMGRATENAKAGLAAMAVAVDKEGNSVAGSLRKLGTAVQDTILKLEGAERGKNLATQIENNANLGQQPVKPDTTGKSKEVAKTLEAQGSGGAIGNITRTASQAANVTLVNPMISGLRALPKDLFFNVTPDAKPSPRSGGTYGAGLDTEKVGSILKITSPGEVVLNAKQQREMATGMANKGVEQAILGFKQLVGQSKSFDPKEISEEITKSISTTKTMSSQSTVKVDVSGGGEISSKQIQTDDSKAAEKEHDKVSKEFSNLKNELRAKIKEQLGPGAKPSDVRKTLTSSDEFKNLESTYKKQLDSLMKRIEDGISYETEIKKQAVSQVEKTVNQELSIVQNVKEKITKTISDAGKEEISISKSSNEIKKQTLSAVEKTVNKELEIVKTSREKISKTVTDATDEEILAARKLTNEQVKIRDAERAEIFKAAEAQKGIIGKSVKGMSDEAIEALLPTGAKLEDFYVGLDETLQSHANDTAKALKEKIAKEQGSIKEIKLEQPKLEQPKLEQPKLNLKEQQETDKVIKQANIEQPTIAKPTIRDIENPKNTELPLQVSMSKMGLKEDQKKIFDELVVLNKEQFNERRQQLASELDSAKQANKAAAQARDVIEERYEKEGRLAELKNDEQFNQLTKEMNASSAQIKKSEEAMEAANRAAEAKVTAEKLGYDIVSETSKKTVDEVKSAQQQIQSDIKDALPVKKVAENRKQFEYQVVPQLPAKELTGQLAEVAKTLDDHGKVTLKYAMRDSEEQNAAYKDTAEKSLKRNKQQIEEKNKLVAELEEKGKTQELSVREKSRLERTKDEITKLEENSKFREQEIAAYKIAEEQKKKMAENTAEVIEKQSEKITTDIKEELSSIGSTAFDLANMEPQGEIKPPVIENQPGTSAFDLANMEPQGEIKPPVIENQPGTSAFDLANMEPQGLSEEMKKEIDQVKKQIESGTVKQVPNQTPSQAEERLKNRQADAAKLKTTTFNKEGKLDLDKINLPGMPTFGFKPGEKVPKTSEAQPKTDENQSSAETARLNRSGTKPQEQPKTETTKKEQGAKDKQATLDDVVKSLDRLNIKMGELISTHESLMAKQISATSQNSSNILDRSRPR